MKTIGQRLTRFSVDHGRIVTALMVGTTLLLTTLVVLPTFAPGSFPGLTAIAVDTDPENMLPADEPARVLHRKIKAEFGISDGVVVGIINEHHPNGIFNVETLGHLHALSAHAKRLEGVVEPEVLSLATVDYMEHGGAGTVRFDWLMGTPPTSEEEALRVRDRTRRIPMLVGSLVSEDSSVAILFVPLTDKHYAHGVVEALEAQIDELGANQDAFHFAGLPVAEETFGIEMFTQMAVSAPLAMLVIFLLMWLFFRNLTVIIAPMIVAMVASLITMALLVVTGNTVHIMTSMLPIFVMPIAVLDSVHIISDFFEHYQKTKDRKATVHLVMRELNRPMLFTSLTTAAGFASLALTPIPPVQTFGIFIAIGVMLAWFLTITFIPAYIGMLSEKRLASFGRPATAQDHESRLARFVDDLTYRKARGVLLVTAILVGVAGFGISQITINDNPTRWFEASHPIRQADRVLNEHFAGTYDVYLTVRATDAAYTPESYAATLLQVSRDRAAAASQVLGQFATQLADAPLADDAEASLDSLDAAVRRQRTEATQREVSGWAAVGHFLDAQYEALPPDPDPDFSKAAFRSSMTRSLATHTDATAASYRQLQASIARTATAAPPDRAAFLAALAADAPAPVTERFVADAAQLGEMFKDPTVLAWLDSLEGALNGMPGVGKTNSVAGVVKTVHRDLVSGEDADFRLPKQRAMVAQTLEQFTMSHRKDDLWHMVTPDYRNSAVWIQLNSADNEVMEALDSALMAWLETSPPPAGLDAPVWSGLTYINSVWQTKMVSGMMDAFVGSFVIVLLMMMLLFRSVLWGLLSMVPLTITVGLTYGIIGLIGKDYDMPVAVLSSLSLGLAIDYAIHFIARARELHAHHGDWDQARKAVFAEPARAIGRNAIVLGVGFLPLLLAPLVPYQTVGVLIAALLLLAGFGTLLILPALIAVLQRWLFPDQDRRSPKTALTTAPKKGEAPCIAS